jgi:homoserine O-acetyltransferase
VRGLTAFAKVYLGWAYSQRFFRDGLYKHLGFPSIDALVDYWIEDHLQQDANDLLAQLRTWQDVDVPGFLQEAAATERAMQGITGGSTAKAVTGTTRGAEATTFACPVIMMPSSTDLYFTAADAARDAQQLGAQLIVLDSDYGHVAGGPGRLSNETSAIFTAVASLLRQST